MYTHVYVSPHLDDVALSCGGRVWQQVQAGDRVLVVTVFAGVPDANGPLSPFAARLHALWNLSADAPATRRREDADALARLGADGVYWPYLDCIYRRVLGDLAYASEEALFGEMHPAEGELVDELADRLADLPLEPGGSIHAPMGIGHHVDHRIVHRAAGRVERPVMYYEDYPYAEDPEAVQEALGSIPWHLERETLSEEALEARIAAIACYDSQFVMLGWAGAPQMAEAVRAFAIRTGQGMPAERYWRPA
jgi:LmbE family N-acetylglucosaminyl deacetylase